MRNYEVRLDAETLSWNLRQVATEEKSATVVAPYLSKEDVIFGAEGLCNLIAIEAYAASLIVIDEHGRIESDRVFAASGPRV